MFKTTHPLTDYSRYGITKHARDAHGILRTSKCSACDYKADDGGFLLGLARHVDACHGKGVTKQQARAAAAAAAAPRLVIGGRR